MLRLFQIVVGAQQALDLAFVSDLVSAPKIGIESSQHRIPESSPECENGAAKSGGLDLSQWHVVNSLPRAWSASGALQ
jgi:hypothetical protein